MLRLIPTMPNVFASINHTNQVGVTQQNVHAHVSIHAHTYTSTLHAAMRLLQLTVHSMQASQLLS